MIDIKDLENEIKKVEDYLKKINKKIEQAEQNQDEEEYIYWSKEGSETEHTIEIFKYLKEKYC